MNPEACYAHARNDRPLGVEGEQPICPRRQDRVPRDRGRQSARCGIGAERGRGHPQGCVRRECGENNADAVLSNARRGLCEALTAARKLDNACRMGMRELIEDGVQGIVAQTRDKVSRHHFKCVTIQWAIEKRVQVGRWADTRSLRHEFSGSAAHPSTRGSTKRSSNLSPVCEVRRLPPDARARRQARLRTDCDGALARAHQQPPLSAAGRRARPRRRAAQTPSRR